jgi:hypothetical protein
MPAILLSDSPRISFFRIDWLAFVVMFVTVCTTNAAETNRTATRAVFPKSVFVHNDPAGKDPFFPNRRHGTTMVIDTNKPIPTVNTDALFLKGFTGTADRRIALINNQTFAKGEEGEVKLGSGKVKIRVVEIKDKSVIIEIEGQSERKELVLPDNTLQFKE